ncbi:alpha/beta hydrolase-fold protein [Aestuariibacter salexigens]|uniref:alpha/beta hydrolase-fold protein n=1 Tax=Aestuariibacter salexigens TaxID=226010 RepID=UPI0003F850F1|nr:alpha/beta hydrolase-fold protein [Aestuariibacter salexigens]
MYIVKVALFVLILVNIDCNADEINITPQGDYSIASEFLIHSNVLNEERTFFISLPDSYNKSDTTYPVLILLDGAQNLEHAVASSRMLSKWKGIPETIIVAIPSKTRVKDFTPTQDLNYSKESGGAVKFSDFIEKEVMEYVDKHYRTHQFRILEGHSLGGLFSAHQFLIGNSFFNAYIIISPALWWDDYHLIRRLENTEQFKVGANIPIYFGIGELDGYGMKQELKQFYDALINKGGSKDVYAHQHYLEEGHMSVTLQSVYDGLQHVFKGAIFHEALWSEFSSDDFIKFIQRTKRVYGSSVTQTGELFSQLSQYLINKGDFVGAITVLKANIESYPEYAFNHEALADVYVLNDQAKLAIEQYKEAVKYARTSNSFGDGVAKRYEAAIELLENPIVHKLATLKLFSGCYVSESDPSSIFKFYLKENNLIGARKEWLDFKLFADTQNSFFMRTQPKLRFEFDKNTVNVFAYGQVYKYRKESCAK